MENLEKLIESRRTVHQFTNEKVDEDLVIKALELSLWAPNHRHTFPWQYILVSDEKRKALIDISIELRKTKDPTLSRVKEEAVRMRLTDPSHWVVLGLKNPKDQKILLEDIATLGASVQIASLFLWEKGIACKWSTGAFSTHEKAYHILGLNPEDTYLMGILFIGGAGVIPPAIQRPAITDVLERK